MAADNSKSILSSFKKKKNQPATAQTPAMDFEGRNRPTSQTAASTRRFSTPATGNAAVFGQIAKAIKDIPKTSAPGVGAPGTLSARAMANGQAKGEDWTSAPPAQLAYNNAYYKTLDDTYHTALYTGLENMRLDHSRENWESEFTQQYKYGQEYLKKELEDYERRYGKNSNEYKALQQFSDDYKWLAGQVDVDRANYRAKSYSDQLDENIRAIYGGLMDKPEFQAKAAEGAEGLSKSMLRYYETFDLDYENASETQKALLNYIYATEGKKGINQFLASGLGQLMTASSANKLYSSTISNDSKAARGFTIGAQDVIQGMTGVAPSGKRMLEALTGADKDDPNDRNLGGGYTISDSVDAYLASELQPSLWDAGISGAMFDLAVERAQMAVASAPTLPEWYKEARKNASDYQKEVIDFFLYTAGEKAAEAVWKEIQNREEMIWNATKKGANIQAKNVDEMLRQMYDQYLGLSGAVPPSFLSGSGGATLPQTLHRAANSAAENLTTIGLQIGLTSLGVPALPARILSAIPQALDFGGRGYTEALEQGAERDKAIGYGITQAGVEYVTDVMLSGMGNLGGVLTGTVRDQAVRKIASPLFRALVDVGVSAGFEFTQEHLQQALEPIWAAYFLDQGDVKQAALDFIDPRNIVDEDRMYAGFLGALSSIMLSAPGAVRDVRTNTFYANFGKAARITNSLGKTVDAILSNPIEKGDKAKLEMYEEAKATAELIKKGVKVSDLAAGKMIADFKRAGGDITHLQDPRTTAYNKENITYDDYVAGITSMLLTMEEDTSMAEDLAKIATEQEISEEAQARINENQNAQEILKQLQGDLNMETDNALTRAARATVFRGELREKVYQFLRQQNRDKTVITPAVQELYDAGVDVEEAKKIGEVINKVLDGVEVTDKEAALIKADSPAIRAVVLSTLDIDLGESADEAAVMSQLNELAKENAKVKEQQAAVQESAKTAAQARGAAMQGGLENGLRQTNQGESAEVSGNQLGAGLQGEVPGAVQEGNGSASETGRNAESGDRRGQRSGTDSEGNGRRLVIPANELNEGQRKLHQLLTHRGFDVVEFVTGADSRCGYSRKGGGYRVQIRVGGQFGQNQYADHETGHLWFLALSNAYRKQVLNEAKEIFGEDFDRVYNFVKDLYDEKGYNKNLTEETVMYRVLEDMLCYSLGQQNFRNKVDFSAYTDAVRAFCESHHLEAISKGDTSDQAVREAIDNGWVNETFYDRKGFNQTIDTDITLDFGAESQTETAEGQQAAEETTAPAATEETAQEEATTEETTAPAKGPATRADLDALKQARKNLANERRRRVRYAKTHGIQGDLLTAHREAIEDLNKQIAEYDKRIAGLEGTSQESAGTAEETTAPAATEETAQEEVVTEEAAQEESTEAKEPAKKQSTKPSLPMGWRSVERYRQIDDSRIPYFDRIKSGRMSVEEAASKIAKAPWRLSRFADAVDRNFSGNTRENAREIGWYLERIMQAKGLSDEQAALISESRERAERFQNLSESDIPLSDLIKEDRSTTAARQIAEDPAMLEQLIQATGEESLRTAEDTAAAVHDILEEIAKEKGWDTDRLSADDPEYYQSVGLIDPAGQTAAFTDNIGGVHEEIINQLNGTTGEDVKDFIARGGIRVKPGVGIEVNGDIAPTMEQYDQLDKVVENFTGKIFSIDFNINGVSAGTHEFEGADIDPNNVYTYLRNYYARRKVDIARNEQLKSYQAILGMPVKTMEDAYRAAKFLSQMDDSPEIQDIIDAYESQRFSADDDTQYSPEVEQYAEDFDTSLFLETGELTELGNFNYNDFLRDGGKTDLNKAPITEDVANYFSSAQSYDARVNDIVNAIIPLYLATDSLGFSAYDPSGKSDDGRSIFLTDSRVVGASYGKNGKNLIDMKALGALREHIAKELGYEHFDDLPLPTSLLEDEEDIDTLLKMYNAMLSYKGKTPWVNRSKLRPLVDFGDVGIQNFADKYPVLSLRASYLQNAREELSNSEYSDKYFSGVISAATEAEEALAKLLTADLVTLDDVEIFLSIYSDFQAESARASESVRQDGNYAKAINELSALDFLDGAMSDAAVVLRGVYYSDEFYGATDTEGNTVSLESIMTALASSGSWAVYANTTNPLVVWGYGQHWSSLNEAIEGAEWEDDFWDWYENYAWRDSEFGDVNTRAIASYAYERGYDSAIITDIYDVGKYGDSEARAKPSNIYVVFKPNQIKSVNNKHPSEDDRMNYSADDILNPESEDYLGPDIDATTARNAQVDDVYRSQDIYFRNGEDAETSVDEDAIGEETTLDEDILSANFDAIMAEIETLDEDDPRVAELWNQYMELQESQKNKTKGVDEPEQEKPKKKKSGKKSQKTSPAAQAFKPKAETAAPKAQETVTPKAQETVAAEPEPAPVSNPEPQGPMTYEQRLNDINRRKEELVNELAAHPENAMDIANRLVQLQVEMFELNEEMTNAASGMAARLENAETAAQRSPEETRAIATRNAFLPATVARARAESNTQTQTRTEESARPKAAPANETKAASPRTKLADENTKYAKKDRKNEWLRKLGKADTIEIRRLRSDRNTFDVRFTDSKGNVITYNDVSPASLTKAFAFKTGDRNTAIARTAQAVSMAVEPSLEWQSIENPAPARISTNVREQITRAKDNQGRTVPEKLTKYLENSQARNEKGELITVYRLAPGNGVHNAKRPGMVSVFSERAATMNTRRGLRGAEAYGQTNKAAGEKIASILEELQKPNLSPKKLASLQKQLADIEAANVSYIDGVTALDPWRPGLQLAKADAIVNGVSLLEGYLDVRRPKVIDARGKGIDFVQNEVLKYVRDPANKAGRFDADKNPIGPHDGFKFLNVNILPEGETLGGGQQDLDTVWVTFRNNQAKSTYNTDPSNDDLMQYSADDDFETGYTEGTLEDTILKILHDKDAERATAALAEYMAQFMQTGVLPEIEEERTRNIFQPKITPEQSKILRDQLKKNIEKYGEMEKGMDPARDVAFPRRTDEGSGRKAYRTAAESKHTPDWSVDALRREFLLDTYQPITDKEAIAYADRVISKKGFSAALAQWEGVIDQETIPMKEAKKTVALGEMLYAEAVKVGDLETAMRVMAEIAEVGTAAGQAVQAFTLLKKMPKSYQLYYFQRVANRLNRQYSKQINNGKMKEIKIDRNLAKAVLNAKTQEELDTAINKLIDSLAQQIPATFRDKWNAWRYLSMLGNPRTHIRNFLGNALFAPAKFSKDLIAAGLESIFIRDPSKRRLSIKAKLRIGTEEYRKFAETDYEGIRKELQRGGKYNPVNEVLERRKIFDSQLLEYLRTANSKLLEWEDGLFLKAHYVNALSAFLATRGMSVADLNTPSRESSRLLNEARQYAFNEALKATYRDVSAVASALNNLKRTPGVGILLEGMLPFTKTPINIAKRGIEYSPIGLLDAITRQANLLKQGEISANDFIDSLSAGLTGTGIAYIGFLLTALGLLRGGKDDDDKKEDADKLVGYQNYSINIGGTNYTIDWMAPSALPLFVGSAIYNELKEKNGLSGADLYNALTVIAEPITQLSMLSGLNDTLKSAKWDDNPVSSVIQSMAAGYISQGIPTFLAQIARSSVENRRTTYVDKNSDVPQPIQRWVQTNVEGKIPGLNDNRPEYIDAWGRKDTTQGFLVRLFDNMLSPGYRNKINITPVDKELMRLSEAVGSSVLMSPAERYIEFSNEKHDLTAKQYETYAVVRGSSTFDMLSRLFNSEAYQSLDDNEKARAVEFIKDYGNVLGKQAVFPEYETNDDNWAEKCDGDSTRLMNMALLKAVAGERGISTGNRGEFYDLIIRSSWLTPIDQGYAIAQQYDIGSSTTVYVVNKGPKWEITPERKEILYENYRRIFPGYYLELTSTPEWRAADNETKLEMLAELRKAVNAANKKWLAEQLQAAGAPVYVEK